jgi:hypothetical protein
MKKHRPILGLLLLIGVSSIVQTLSNENFIYSTVPQKEVQRRNH